jgi:hypothetical protein
MPSGTTGLQARFAVESAGMAQPGKLKEGASEAVCLKSFSPFRYMHERTPCDDSDKEYIDGSFR